MGIVLRGGTIVTAVDYYKADVRIEGEKIVAIGKEIILPEDIILDVEGHLLLPGGVDVHTHFDLPVGNTVTADDFTSGTQGAIMGGTTTIIDYATQFKGQTLKEALTNWHAKAQGACYVDYGFHMAITEWNDDIAEEIGWLSQSAGVTSIKLYMAYKNLLQVDDDILFQALVKSKQCGVLVCVHCENGDMIYNLVKRYRSQGNVTPYYHPLSRPIVAEEEAVYRIIALAHAAQSSVYIVHLSSNNALQVVMNAKCRGNRVYAETCPQYLLLDESFYSKDHFESAKYVISPPLRKKENQDFLWQGLHDGMLDVVATDHCSFNFHGQKDAGLHDFSMIPNGIPGVENRLGLLYTYGVVPGKISINTFVNVTATQPAKIFGLFPRKGTIAPGSDADIVVWDVNDVSVISAQAQQQRVDYTPYEGFQQKGKALHVFLRGQQVVQNGNLCDGDPQGIYLLRKLIR
ncbi:dihydropyrimidinase [Pelosinus fermentans]|uniref:Dihydropyrimidinase n=1 Tax=Pelosinus fermentans JBW45 TaxID=1192197 RepID=I8U273_9FIRM|nr:dihydropyrimidinase [Pelosinus fermentans]AJQ27874.1 dihydropyrimidinase [Pelosinus fermentans JBW45]